MPLTSGNPLSSPKPLTLIIRSLQTLLEESFAIPRLDKRLYDSTGTAEGRLSTASGL